MKRLLILAGLVSALLTAPLSAYADSRPVLRSEVATLSDIVTVGDFYTNAGSAASKPLYRSPDLGTSGTVSATQIAKRARDAGLLLAGTDGLTSVIVHRRAEVYDEERLKSLVAQELAKRDASLSREDIQITFYRQPKLIHANPAVENPITVDRLLWSRADGRFSVFLNTNTGKGIQPLSLSGYASEMVQIIALAQPMRRGSIIKPEHLTRIRLPRNQVTGAALRDEDEIIGLAARSNLRPNSPIARNNFERPLMITRGEKITVTFELPGMKLTTRGQAMDNGAAGDMIDIMNLQSRRIVPATVISRGLVRVDGNAPVVASLNEVSQ